MIFYISNLFLFLLCLEKVISCGLQKRCFRVLFKDSPINAHVDSAQLWVHKNQPQNNTLQPSVMKFFKVRKTVSAIKHKQLIHVAKFENNEKGWFATEIKTHRITKLTKSGKSYIDLVLDIECQNCQLSQKTNKRPFITLSTVTELQKRRKRSSDKTCSSKTSCCRKSLKVDFKLLNWDNWVMAPSSYNAYYCDGNCSKGNSFDNKHTGILKAIAEKTRRKDIKVCCSPKKYSSLDLLYVHNGNLVRRVIDNMIVDECWCT